MPDVFVPRKDEPAPPEIARRLTIAELDRIEQRAARRARVTMLVGIIGALVFIYVAQWMETHGYAR